MQTAMPGKSKSRYVRWFANTGIEDVPVVGGKNASLGEMYRELTPHGIKVPNGFALTAEAYWDLLDHAGLTQAIRELLEGLDTANVKELHRRGSEIRHLIMAGELIARFHTEWTRAEIG